MCVCVWFTEGALCSSNILSKRKIKTTYLLVTRPPCQEILDVFESCLVGPARQNRVFRCLKAKP